MKIDLLLKNALLFNVYIKSWSKADVAILDGKFLYVGDTSSFELEPNEIIDCDGAPLIPGLIDIHMHIESSMCSPSRFAEAALISGTTTIVSEPHEVANVLGIEGIRGMIQAGENTPLDIFYGVPSSVPSSSLDLETSGGVIDLNHLEELLREDSRIICLGEVMNYRDLAQLKPSRARDFVRKMQDRFPFAAVEGHCPSIIGRELSHVLFTGVDSDHCLQTPEALEERLISGMFVEIQEKSICPEIMEVLNKYPSDGLYSIVTDDVPIDVLNEKGHLSHLLAQAVEAGLPLESAIIAATLSPARRMGFRDRGAIAPGKIADALLLEDRSSSFKVKSVLKNGKTYNGQEEVLHEVKAFPDSFYRSIGDLQVNLNDFVVPAPKYLTEVTCRIMEKNHSDTYTKHSTQKLPIVNGQVDWQGAGVNLVVVMDRYSGKCRRGNGFLGGNVLKNCGFASTYAHDSHNLLVIGDNPEDMQRAAAEVIDMQGGIAVASGGAVEASLPLPVAGLMSEEKVPEIAAKKERIRSALTTHGYIHPNPVMSLTTITLPVSPELKITDRGLVDVIKGELVPLFVE